jgi:hypothetical protein
VIKVKTLNEIREEFGLRPLPGLDSVIMTPDYLNWMANHSPEAKAEQAANMEMQQEQADANTEQETVNNDVQYVREQEAAAMEADRSQRAQELQNKVTKSLTKVKVETYETKD